MGAGAASHPAGVRARQPGMPPPDDWAPDDPDAIELGSPSFQRIVEEKEGGGWQYRWTKEDWSLTNHAL